MSNSPNGRQDRLPGTTPDSGNNPSPTSLKIRAHEQPEADQSDRQPLVDHPPGRNFPESVGHDFDVFLGGDGNTYLLPHRHSNPIVLKLNTRACDAFLRQCAHQRGRVLKTSEIREISDALIAHAELAQIVRDVWVRAAPYEDGFEIDLGDAEHTLVRVMPRQVEVLTTGSDIPYWRPATQRPLTINPDKGDITLLRKYVNLHATEQVLLVIWIVYILAHAKVETTVYVILLLLGPQGAGKSVLTRIIQLLVDPSSVGVQTLPRNPRDLAIAAQMNHLLCIDNAREIPTSMSDILCLTSTGGSLNTRRLYSNDEQMTLQLRVALVLNSLHPILGQPDLAQRSLPLTLQPLDSSGRRREKELMAEFEVDRPTIFRGLLELAAAILAELPNGNPTQSERMAEFSAWLSAAERVDGAPAGAYEIEYARVLTDGMRDALLEHPLAAAVMGLVEGRPDGAWSGTPSHLLEVLGIQVGRRVTYSPEWPRTPSALSKRLLSLSGGLRRQGIDVEFGRGRERRITLTLREGDSHA